MKQVVRRPVAFSVVLVFLVACTAPPSREAREREALLLRIPLDEFKIPQEEPLGTFSDPGTKRQGHFGTDVEVSHSFRYVGDERLLCASLETQLSTLGVNTARACDDPMNDLGQTGSIVTSGTIHCSTFDMFFAARVFSAHHKTEELRSVVRISVSAPYPGDEPSPAVTHDATTIDCEARWPAET